MQRRKARERNKSKRNCPLRIVSFIVESSLIIFLTVLFLARIVNSVRFHLPDGVQEKIYIQLGGIEQFVNIRGQSAENPVIIWLHGGPGSPDTFVTTTFQQKLEADYTFIRWDQRGCGRTYYKNKTAPVSWELLFADLNELVAYANARFNQPVIIVGHSWGSVLGSTYAAAHPEKIAGYVGIGQSTDFRESEKLAAEKAIEMAHAVGNETDAMKIAELYQSYLSTGYASERADANAFLRFVRLRELTANYLSPNDRDPAFTILTSPDFGWNDLRWQLRSKITVEQFLESHQSLYIAMSVYFVPHTFDVPVMFIQGENDYVCSTVLVKEYQASVSAPRSEIFIMPGLGHSPMEDDPAAFAQVLKKALDLII